MSDTQILLVGSTSILTPAELSERIADIERSGLKLLSAYEAGGVLYGVFRKSEPMNPFAGPPVNPFQPEHKSYVE